MSYPSPNRPCAILSGALLMLSCSISADQGTAAEIVIDDGTIAATDEGMELVIEDDAGSSAIEDTEITIDAGDPGGEITIEEPADTSDLDTGATTAADIDVTGDRFNIRLDEARIELGHFPDSGSETETSIYGHLSASANWQPNPTWEFQLAARVDAYDEDDANSFTTVRGDYGDSYIRYRGDNVKLTLGSQTVIWGRLDELPLSDRVSTVDLTRGLLDDLEYRRRSTPMLRAESFFGGGKLDLVWLYDFREAELPDRDSVWYPIDQGRGRLLGIDPDDIPATVVRNAAIRDDEPSGDGGFGMRYQLNHALADIGVTAGRVRQSIPYFRIAQLGTVLQAEFPRSWVFGTDAAINTSYATWRVELVYSSDNPVTRSDLRYDTTPAVQWGAGLEFHPGDGDTRVNLQIIGTNLIDAPRILDRSEVYSFNGEIEIPFDRERWRADIDFYLGLDDKDIYLNPEIAFLGWEPHEVYLGAYYFDGDDKTIGGFYQDQSTITLGWRAKF